MQNLHGGNSTSGIILIRGNVELLCRISLSEGETRGEASVPALGLRQIDLYEIKRQFQCSRWQRTYRWQFRQHLSEPDASERDAFTFPKSTSLCTEEPLPDPPLEVITCDARDAVPRGSVEKNLTIPEMSSKQRLCSTKVTGSGGSTHLCEQTFLFKDEIYKISLQSSLHECLQLIFMIENTNTWSPYEAKCPSPKESHSSR